MESALNGAVIDNRAAGTPNLKSITITNFVFNGNVAGFGLDAKSRGGITLTGVQANENGTTGASLNNDYVDITDRLKPLSSNLGVTVKTSVMNGNTGGNGLDITTSGAVFLDGVNANLNTVGTGIWISSVPLVPGTKTVTINRTMTNENGADGLEDRL